MLIKLRCQRACGRSRRRGATIVEAALVLSVFLLLLFGIFEYCRFLFVLHVTNNAAREGARFAAVNTNCTSASQMIGSPNVPSSVWSTQSTTQAAVQAYTAQMMSNVQYQIWTSSQTPQTMINVFAADPSGLASNPPVIQAWSSASSWNNTSFPNSVAVQITGNYVPVLPTFLIMPSSIPISITAVMLVE